MNTKLTTVERALLLSLIDAALAAYGPRDVSRRQLLTLRHKLLAGTYK